MDPATARKMGLVEPQQLAQRISNRQLAALLKKSAKEARTTIETLVGSADLSDQIRVAQLRAASRELDALATRLWSQVGDATYAGIRQAGQLAAKQSVEMDELLLPADKVDQLRPYLYFNAESSAEAILARRVNGYNLSDRVYANAKVSIKNVHKILDQGLSKQLSARDIAKQVAKYINPNVAGGVRFAAMRLARTEINNAHHEMSIALSKDKPWVTGFKWNLSGSHGRPDQCNEYANIDRDDLGAGVFAKGDVPKKPHPQCLCYVTHIQMDDKDFLADLKAGKFDKYISGE